MFGAYHNKSTRLRALLGEMSGMEVISFRRPGAI